jgi:hypothetical protein
VVIDDGWRCACAPSRRPVLCAELPGAQHGFDLYHSLRFGAVINAIEAFATQAVATAPTRHA